MERLPDVDVRTTERKSLTVNIMANCSLRHLLDCAVQEMSCRFGGLELSQQETELSEDACTVSTVFVGEHPSAVALCADREVFVRLAQSIMGRAAVTPKDVEDVAKEYFNIICGKIVAGLFELTRTAPRFQIPRFTSGLCKLQVDGADHQCVLNYQHADHGSVRLIYMGLKQNPCDVNPIGAESVGCVG